MKELYRIKFDPRVIDYWDNGVLRSSKVWTIYKIGVSCLVIDEELTPLKIRKVKDRIIVDFAELGIQHNFAFKEDTELFYRDKPKQEENEKD